MKRFGMIMALALGCFWLLAAAPAAGRSERTARTERASKSARRDREQRKHAKSSKPTARDERQAKRVQEERRESNTSPKSKILVAPDRDAVDKPKGKISADTFDQAVTRKKPLFKGAFTVGLIFVNFPDCHPIDSEAYIAQMREKVEQYFRRYTHNQCWPTFVTLGTYDCPDLLGSYTRWECSLNKFGCGDDDELIARGRKLYEAARSRYKRASGGRAQVDVTAIILATRVLPASATNSSVPKTLEQLPILREHYPAPTEHEIPQDEDELRAIGFREHKVVDPLRYYNPRQIRWGDPLWPNASVLLWDIDGADTVIHELGHVLGAPDTYHAPELNGGRPGNPLWDVGGPTAPLYARYRYCGLDGPDAYPILRQNATLRLAPRWNDFDGTKPLGVFIPTEHPYYLLHLEYEPGGITRADSASAEAAIGRPATSPGKGGIRLYAINVTLNSGSYLGAPDLVYAYRQDDPYFRGAAFSFPANQYPCQLRQRPVIFREGDRFNAESNPANLLPNQLPSGVSLTFGPQTGDYAEVTITVPTKRLSGPALAQSLLPKISMEAPTEVLPTSLRATLVERFRGEEHLTELGFCYGPSPNPTLRNSVWPLWGFTDWYDTSRIMDLRPGSTLYLRAYAKSPLGVAYSPECHKVTLPTHVETISPLCLDLYYPEYCGPRYDKEGYIHNDSGASCLLKLFALYRRPIGAKASAAKRSFNYARLHPYPKGDISVSTRAPETLTDLKAAASHARHLATEAALDDATFTDDFDERVCRALGLSNASPRQVPADLLQQARTLGLSNEQAKALCARVVPFDSVSLPLLLPRIKASLEAGQPVLCVRSMSYNSRFLYALESALIDGYRPTNDNPEAKAELHLVRPAPPRSVRRNDDSNAPRLSPWLTPAGLCTDMKSGRLVFLN